MSSKPMSPAKPAWEYYDYDNSKYRRPGPRTAVSDVLIKGKWTPVTTGDRTAPHVFGDRIADPAPNAE